MCVSVWTDPQKRTHCIIKHMEIPGLLEIHKYFMISLVVTNSENFEAYGLGTSVLPTESITTSIEIMAWISNYIHINLWDIITHRWPKFDSGVAEAVLRLAMDAQLQLTALCRFNYFTMSQSQLISAYDRDPWCEGMSYACYVALFLSALLSPNLWSCTNVNLLRPKDAYICISKPDYYYFR